jgi:glycosyltransferase involved in cell wall biosynthesis
MGSAFDDWILVIAGTDEFGHKAEVCALVERLGLQEKVRIVGPLFGQTKRDAFAAADLFILPSYSEGAPVVVLDSLAAGVPVVTTKGAPWEDLVTFQCGWWTDISAGGLLEALREAVVAPRETLALMGQRGRQLVASRYGWTSLAQKTIDLYAWLLGRRDRPDFVVDG